MTAVRPARVFVDALALKPELGGIATYIRSVVRELSNLDSVHLTVVTGRAEGLDEMSRCEIVEAPRGVEHYRSRVAWRERHFRDLVKTHQADVLFAPTIELPLRSPGLPSMMVVHDLGPAQSPALYGWPRWLRYHLLLRHSLTIANRIVCVSAATELQLVSAMRVDRSKLVVIGEATDVAPAVEPGAESPSEFVLHVGAILPHKNFETLLSALARPRGEKLRLVAAGPATKAEIAELNGRAAELGVGGRFEHRGFVERTELESLYASAKCLALPTLNEGFGLPLLEAQARGVPVVASRVPALVEVGGERGANWIDDPLDAEAWAASLAELSGDDARRAALIDYGRERAAGYSWARVAEGLAAELRGLAGVHG